MPLGEAFFGQRVFRRCLGREARAPGARSIAIEGEDAAVFEWNFDWLPGFGALVEQVEVGLRIVVWNPFTDGLPVGGGRLETVGGRIVRAGGFSFFARLGGGR